jgi:hypothetical protein
MIPDDVVGPINCITPILLLTVMTLDVTTNTPMCEITQDFLAVALLGTGVKLPWHQWFDPYSDERLASTHLQSHQHMAMSARTWLHNCGVNVNISVGNHIVHRVNDFIWHRDITHGSSRTRVLLPSLSPHLHSTHDVNVNYLTCLLATMKHCTGRHASTRRATRPFQES